jgi:hypothetical protein
MLVLLRFPVGDGADGHIKIDGDRRDSAEHAWT